MGLQVRTMRAGGASLCKCGSDGELPVVASGGVYIEGGLLIVQNAGIGRTVVLSRRALLGRRCLRASGVAGQSHRARVCVCVSLGFQRRRS